MDFWKMTIVCMRNATFHDRHVIGYTAPPIRSTNGSAREMKTGSTERKFDAILRDNDRLTIFIAKTRRGILLWNRSFSIFDLSQTFLLSSPQPCMVASATPRLEPATCFPPFFFNISSSSSFFFPFFLPTFFSQSRWAHALTFFCFEYIFLLVFSLALILSYPFRVLPPPTNSRHSVHSSSTRKLFSHHSDAMIFFYFYVISPKL